MVLLLAAAHVLLLRTRAVADDTADAPLKVVQTESGVEFKLPEGFDVVEFVQTSSRRIRDQFEVRRPQHHAVWP